MTKRENMRRYSTAEPLRIALLTRTPAYMVLQRKLKAEGRKHFAPTFIQPSQAKLFLGGIASNSFRWKTFE